MSDEEAFSDSLYQLGRPPARVGMLTYSFHQSARRFGVRS
jgi:hypothetical protein